MRKLVILRPEPGAGATLARAKEAGLDAVAIPLFEVCPLEWNVPAGTYDALMLTSANAIRHGGPQLEMLHALPAYCVGAATAEAARGAGFTLAAVGQGNAASLAGEIARDLRLLHLAGQHARLVPGATAVAVYDNVPIDPPPEMSAVQGSVAMVHSPRAGERLSALIEQRSDIAIAAISKAAADACGEGWDEVAVAATPDDAALLAVAAELCQNRER